MPALSEKLPDESALWYGRFRAFCDQPHPRSVLALYNAERQKVGKPPAKHPPGSWTAAVSRFRWTARAGGFDSRRDTIADEAREQVIRLDAAERTREQLRADRRRQQEDEEWEFRKLLLDRAREMFAAQLYKKTGISADGKTVTIAPAKWSMFTAVQMIDQAFKLGRASARMPLRVEAETTELGVTFFETSGQLDEAMPAGALPEMPEDSAVKPVIGSTISAATRSRGVVQQPEIERPGGDAFRR